MYLFIDIVYFFECAQIWNGTLHKFNKKDIRENPCDSWFFNKPQISTNFHELFEYLTI